MRRLYTALLTLALPVILARLWWRGRRERGYRGHVGERLGRYSLPRKPSWYGCMRFRWARRGRPRPVAGLRSALRTTRSS